MAKSPGNQCVQEYDAVVVGAGFAGMYILYKLLRLGLKVIVLEEATGVGGTWYWNRYPGARCDVESMEYSYSFSDDLQQEWEWSYRFSTQPEILEYANHVADRFNLRDSIKFNSRVESAMYNESIKRWIVMTDSGESFSSKYCVMATGTLSTVNLPKFDGIDRYKGDWYMTGRWPHHSVDFTGKTVGIIGTGSSAVQAIPVIAEQAKHLTVFQRTPNYSIPANNRPLESEEANRTKADYSDLRSRARSNRGGIGRMRVGTQNALSVSDSVRTAEYQQRWDYEGTGFAAAYLDIGTDEKANETAAEFVRTKIRETVSDPKTADLLSPTNAIACKRLCMDTNYYETYNRDNVSLIDINETPIVGLVEDGVQTSEDVFKFDVVVFAIGFDAMTGALLAIDIRGKHGISLREKWTDGPRAYLGLSSEGFPNLFMITGPGSPSVLSNMMTSIEQHVEWINDCVEFMETNGKTEIDADISAENRWMDHVAEVADATLRYSCNSWYLGANVPGKKRIFVPYAGGLPKYIEKCNEETDAGYPGFNIT